MGPDDGINRQILIHDSLAVLLDELAARDTRNLTNAATLATLNRDEAAWLAATRQTPTEVASDAEKTE